MTELASTSSGVIPASFHFHRSHSVSCIPAGDVTNQCFDQEVVMTVLNNIHLYHSDSESKGII